MSSSKRGFNNALAIHRTSETFYAKYIRHVLFSVHVEVFVRTRRDRFIESFETMLAIYFCHLTNAHRLSLTFSPALCGSHLA